MLNYQNEYFLQSVPLKIKWAGFISDTLTLQNNGWTLAIEDRCDHFLGRHEVRFILKHQMLDLYCVTYLNTFDFGELTSHLIDRKDFIDFHIQTIGKEIYYQGIPEFRYDSINEIDCRPEYKAISYDKISEMSIFKTLIKPESTLIVEPERISDLLKQIVEAQAPNQAEIRERIRRGEARNNFKQTLHAQILSVAS